MASELLAAELEQVYVKTDNGCILINSIGKNNALILFLRNNVRLGHVFLELKLKLDNFRNLCYE